MSITSTSRFFHVSEVSVFCCLTNSIRPEGCREYMHRSLSLGSGRDGSCGGANILENSQKNLKKWGKYFYSDGSNPHSAGIRTHSQFKKFLYTQYDLTSPASTCKPKSPIYLIDVKQDQGKSSWSWFIQLAKVGYSCLILRVFFAQIL